MNIYEDESLEAKLEELSDRLGLLVLDLLLVGLRKLGRETLIFREFAQDRAACAVEEPPEP